MASSSSSTRGCLFQPLKSENLKFSDFRDFKQTPPKKKSIEAVLSNHPKVQNEDRLSNLPEPLLSKILSLLPTDEAIATSILSKRWRFLWTSITNLDISDNRILSSASTRKLTKADFSDHVNRILLLLDPPVINKFSLYLCLYSDHFHINKWICDAIARNVREFELGLWVFDEHPIELPRSLLYLKTLEVLKLSARGIEFNIPKSDSVCFPSLKVLHLDHVFCGEILIEEGSICFPVLKTLHLFDIAEEDSLSKLIRICPVLEDVFIKCGPYYAYFDVFAPALTRLEIDVGDETFESEIQIDAPVLQYLTISGWYFSQKFIIKKPSSLIEAKLIDLNHDDNVNGEEGDAEYNFMKADEKVQCLIVSGYHTVDHMKAGVPNFPVFCNLTLLEVDVSCCGLSVLHCFLENSIKLQHLVISMLPSSFQKHRDVSCPVEQKWWPELAPVPKCLLSTLRIVEMRRVVGCTIEFPLIENILKNATKLEKMTIQTSNMKFGSKYLLLQKISLVPRGSTACKVSFS